MRHRGAGSQDGVRQGGGERAAEEQAAAGRFGPPFSAIGSLCSLCSISCNGTILNGAWQKCQR